MSAENSPQPPMPSEESVVGGVVKKTPMPAAILEALRLGENETTSTIGHGGSRIWLYPREVAGYFIQRRVWVGWLLICVYLGIPWLRWHGEAIFRVDVFDRKLVFLGHYFFAQDIRLFLPGIFSFVLIVFLVTATWGRIWCGWACPQTVFLQFLFGPLEKMIEGKAAKRQKRDSMPIHFEWVWRKVVKHFVFALVALGISNTAVAYFLGTDSVLFAMTHSPQNNVMPFTLMTVFAAVFYWVFAYFREQACIIVCPYAKFQSVLLDEKTKVVAYDALRGEKRGRGAKREGLGDCVECKQCVLVCPTGIDIRQGNQLECIGCTRCIDACDRTMEAWKKPTGLIRYASLHELQGKGKGRIRIRPFVYGTLAGIAMVVCGILLYTRPLLAVDVLRRGSEPYLHIGQDTIQNSFTVHIRNKDISQQVCKITISDPKSAHHNWETRSFTIGSGEIKTLPLEVKVARSDFAFGKREMTLEIEGSQSRRSIKTTLVGPFGN